MGLEALLAGHLLCDRYRVEAVIGRGGMGAVYRATDTRLEREVAVKVIVFGAGDVAARVRMRGRFQREARAAARLQHPHVVTVHDFGTDTRFDLDFLVMELLRGEDLATRLARDGPPPPAEGLEILRQATHGVAAGHRAGLVHRDIKPGNLFLVDAPAGSSRRPRICVLDFGIVQLDAAGDDTVTHLTIAGAAPHSPAYAAPEQLRGDSGVGPACDVWALGVTAFQLLAAQRPFSEVELRRLAEGRPVAPPSLRARVPAIPVATDEVLRTALAFRPADRFADAGEMAEALEAAAEAAVDPAARKWEPAGAARVHTRPGTRRDETLLEPPSLGRALRWGVLGVPRPAAQPDETVLGGPPPVTDHTVAVPQPARPAAPPPTTAPTPQRGWLARGVSLLASLALTTASVAISGALIVGLFRAFDAGLTGPFYASLIGLTCALPWAVYRLTGRRGSYLFGLIGAALAAVAVIRLVTPLTDPVTAVLILPPAQLLACAWLIRFTARRPDRSAGQPA